MPAVPALDAPGGALPGAVVDARGGLKRAILKDLPSQVREQWHQGRQVKRVLT